jgi:hypothetical protein
LNNSRNATRKFQRRSMILFDMCDEPAARNQRGSFEIIESNSKGRSNVASAPHQRHTLSLG